MPTKKKAIWKLNRFRKIVRFFIKDEYLAEYSMKELSDTYEQCTIFRSFVYPQHKNYSNGNKMKKMMNYDDHQFRSYKFNRIKIDKILHRKEIASELASFNE